MNSDSSNSFRKCCSLCLNQNEKEILGEATQLGPMITPIRHKTKRSTFCSCLTNNAINMEKRQLFNLLKLITTPWLSFNPGVSFTISRTEFSKRSMFDLHSPSLPRVFPTSGWEVIDPSLPIEEETIPTYRVEKFYPVYIGEVFKPSISSSGQIGLWI